MANVSVDKSLPPPPVVYLQNELPETSPNPEVQEDQLTTLNEQEIDKVQQEYSYIDDFSPRKRALRHVTNFSADVSIGNIEQAAEGINDYTTEEDQSTNASHSDEEDIESVNNDDFEDYSCPPLEPFQDLSAAYQPTSDNQFLWILLWIMKFWARFNISEMVTDSLIKFIKLVLSEFGGNDKFEDFPETLYKLR